MSREHLSNPVWFTCLVTPHGAFERKHGNELHYHHKMAVFRMFRALEEFATYRLDLAGVNLAFAKLHTPQPSSHSLLRLPQHDRSNVRIGLD